MFLDCYADTKHGTWHDQRAVNVIFNKTIPIEE